jgi:hypothetical protein
LSSSPLCLETRRRRIVLRPTDEECMPRGVVPVGSFEFIP